jgi:hypothetical protein
MSLVELEVANPVAESASVSITPAARLADLADKKIGLYWNFKPGGNIGLDRVATLLAERYPGITFRHFEGTVGAAVRHITPQQADDAAAEFDAVVGTTGDCGGCTSWLAHDMKELEKRGVPTVGLVSDDFIKDYIRTGTSYGIPELEYAHMAEPLVSQTPEAISKIIDGAIEHVVSGLLTAPNDSADQEERPDVHDVVIKREPWFTFRGTDLLAAAYEMNEQFLEWQYGDGFPLLPATRKQVDHVLSGTTRDRGEVLGLLEPGDGIVTVEKIAINAAMAGCAPRHLPIVIAAVEAMADYHMDLREKAISTGPAAPFIMVNGAARQLAGLNTGICMLGPGAPSRSNTVIGRALRLCMMNIGHTYPAISDMDTIGSPNKYSMCLAENEERSPWEPYHVSQGFSADESTVTVGFVYGLNDLTDYHSLTPEIAIKKWATAAKYLCVTSTGFWLVGPRGNPHYGNVEEEHEYLLLAPQHTRVFQEAGWTKADISEALYREARLPFSLISKRLEESAIRTAHPELDWLWDSPDTLVPVLKDPSCFEVIVAGSPGSNRSSYSWGQGSPVTKKILQADLEL